MADVPAIRKRQAPNPSRVPAVPEPSAVDQPVAYLKRNYQQPSRVPAIPAGSAHPGLQPAPVFPRAPRAGQRVPRPGAAGAKRTRVAAQRVADSGDYDGDDEAAEEPAPRPGPRRHDHASRMQEQDNAWAAARPAMTADFVAYAEQNHEIQEQRRKVLVQSVQDRLDAACACWKGQHGGCQVVEQRVCMPVVGLSYSGTLQIADVTCSTCSTSFQPSALQVGCFPSSPVDPHRWYDLDVFNAFQVLALQDGLSASGFVDFLNEHSQPAAAVDDRQFVLSFFAWLRMSFEVDSWSALGVEGMDSGPFAECPICCTLPGEGGRLGTPTVTAARDLLPATGEAAQPPQQAGDPVPPPPPPVLAVGAPAAGEPAAELADEVALHVHA